MSVPTGERLGVQSQVGRLYSAAVQPVQDVRYGDHPHPCIVAVERVSERLHGRQRQL